MLTAQRIDHLVLTCRDVAATIRFYTEVLGMREVTFGNGRKALAFGRQKINLHAAGRPRRGRRQRGRDRGQSDPRLRRPLPDRRGAPRRRAAHLAACGVPVEEGPCMRTGALGPIESVYVRDPDGNLIELSRYVDE